jgi:hypothetical protein
MSHAEIRDPMLAFTISEVYFKNGKPRKYGKRLATARTADAAARWITSNCPKDRREAGHYSIDGPEPDKKEKTT